MVAVLEMDAGSGDDDGSWINVVGGGRGHVGHMMK